MRPPCLFTIAVVFFALAGCGPPSTGPLHCGDSSSVCIDFPEPYSKAEVQDLCAQHGVRDVQSGLCAHEGTVGVCIFTVQGGTEEDWWGYPASYSVTDYQSFCESKQGLFAPAGH